MITIRISRNFIHLLPILPTSNCSYATTSSQFSSHESSINREEIDRFSNLSSHWWNPYGFYRLLHKMNPVRTSYIKTHTTQLLPLQHITQGLHGYKILDVGCGGGLLSEGLARLGANVLGIDADEAGINVAKEHAKKDFLVEKNVNYLNTTPEQLMATHPSSFDVVCALEIIEHVSNRPLFLKSCINLLKQNGLLFISTINRTPISYFLTIFMAEHVLSMVPKYTHTYNQYVTPNELKSELSSVDCILRDLSGMVFNPVRGDWKLIKAKGMDYKGGLVEGFIKEAALQANYIACATKS